MAWKEGITMRGEEKVSPSNAYNVFCTNMVSKWAKGACGSESDNAVNCTAQVVSPKD